MIGKNLTGASAETLDGSLMGLWRHSAVGTQSAQAGDEAREMVEMSYRV